MEKKSKYINMPQNTKLKQATALHIRYLHAFLSHSNWAYIKVIKWKYAHKRKKNKLSTKKKIRKKNPINLQYEKKSSTRIEQKRGL